MYELNLKKILKYPQKMFNDVCSKKKSCPFLFVISRKRNRNGLRTVNYYSDFSSFVKYYLQILTFRKLLLYMKKYFKMICQHFCHSENSFSKHIIFLILLY